MRFDRFPKIEPVPPSKRRLAAAKRAIERETKAAGLFPEMYAPTESPEERIARQDALNARHWQQVRDSNARDWREARAEFYTLPSEKRWAIRQAWKTCGWPGDGAYFAIYLRWWGEELAIITDLTDVAFGKEQGG